MAEFLQEVKTPTHLELDATGVTPSEAKEVADTLVKTFPGKEYDYQLVKEAPGGKLVITKKKTADAE